MLHASIFQNWDGKWTWEIVDEGEMYLRSDRIFPNREDAVRNIEIACHLVRNNLELH